MPSDYSKMTPDQAHFAKMQDDLGKYLPLSLAAERATESVVTMATQLVKSRKSSNRSDSEAAFGGTPASTAAFSQAVSERFKHYAGQLRGPNNEQISEQGLYSLAFDVSQVAWQPTADGYIFTIGAQVEAKNLYPSPGDQDTGVLTGDSSFSLKWDGKRWKETEATQDTANQSKPAVPLLRSLISTLAASATEEARKSRQ